MSRRWWRRRRKFAVAAVTGIAQAVSLGVLHGDVQAGAVILLAVAGSAGVHAARNERTHIDG